MKTTITSLLILINAFDLIKGDFESYSSNCGYTYDSLFEAFFPINYCSNTSTKHSPFSNIYRCEMDDDDQTIVKRYTYQNANCSGDHWLRSTIVEEDDTEQDSSMYMNCGDVDTYSNTTGDWLFYPDMCFMKWQVETSSEAVYDRFIIVGTCSPLYNTSVYESFNVFSKCDSKGNLDYVQFIDSHCCNLSLSSMEDSSSSPRWTEVEWDTIEADHIDSDDDFVEGSLECMMSSKLMKDKNGYIFTDNENDQCDSAKQYYLVKSTIMFIAILVSLMV